MDRGKQNKKRETVRTAFAWVLVLIIAPILAASMHYGCAGGGNTSSSAALTPQEGVVYYLNDHLGNANLVTDSLGNVKNEETRYPYGIQRQLEVKVEGSTQPQSQSESESAVDYVFTGKEYDEETGLVYFGGRYYSPALGRWITADPLFTERPSEVTVRSAETNLYVYALNNPQTFIDPDGRQTVLPHEPHLVMGEGAQSVIHHVGGTAVEVKYDATKLAAAWSMMALAESMMSMRGPHGQYGAQYIGAHGPERILSPAATSSGKPLYRYMSQAEANAVRETGLLRGGRSGETFWTDSRFTSAARAENRLSLETKPEVRMEFRLINNPLLERNGTRVQSANGGAGGGREYMSLNPVGVEVINVQPLTH